jgi:hypothetical protein
MRAARPSVCNRARSDGPETPFQSDVELAGHALEWRDPVTCGKQRVRACGASVADPTGESPANTGISRHPEATTGIEPV